jgi:putative aldouronate transport system substrate-binding protein
MRKALVMLLVVVLGCSLFAAGTKEAPKVQAAPKMVVTFPLKEPLTLDFIIAGIANLKDPNGLEFFKAMEAKTNVHINWEMINTGWTEKKSLIFANNELPDAFFGAKAFTNTDIANNSTFLEPLEDYIAAYCPNIQKMFTDYPEYRKYVTSADGHIYTLPQRMPLRPETRNLQYINKAWLDKLGLAVPQTTEEFYQVLKAFKTGDPNGNGKADEIPFIFDELKPANGMVSIFGAFGLAENTSGDWIMVEKGKVSYIFADPRLKDAIKYMHKLYSEGLVDTEVFTQPVGQLNAKVRNPEVALVGSGYNWTIEAAMNNATRAKDYVALPPLKGPNGDQLWRPSTIMTGDNIAFVLSKNNPAKEVTMAWIDQFYDPKLGIQLYFGPEGSCLEIGSDGRYTILPSKDPKMTADAWMWANGLNDRSPIFIDENFEKNINWNSWVAEKLIYDKIYAPYAAKVEEYPPFMHYTKAESDEMTMIHTEMNKFATQKIAQWVVNGTIDAEWDAYRKQLDNIGLARLIQIRQKAYDNFKK